MSGAAIAMEQLMLHHVHGERSLTPVMQRLKDDSQEKTETCRTTNGLEIPRPRPTPARRKASLLRRNRSTGNACSDEGDPTAHDARFPLCQE